MTLIAIVAKRKERKSYL